MVANHPTLVDQAALSAVFGRFVCVAKPLLFRVPMLGQVLGACAYLEGGEMEGLAAAATVTQALRSAGAVDADAGVSRGDPVTRRRPAAVPAGAVRDRLPRRTSPWCRFSSAANPARSAKGTPWYGIPPRTAFLTVTRLPVMSPAAFGGDASSLTEACEATFRRHLGLPNPRNAHKS